MRDGLTIGWKAIFPMVFLVLLTAGVAVPPGAFAAKPDGCIACHSDPAFLVKNKKLYDYYKNWKLSVHSQEGISCGDCHGGNPATSNKKLAHSGNPMGSEAKNSPINYRNIPRTCARCHTEIFDNFRKSAHYKQLIRNSQRRQAPNCVTCHGSVNISVLSVRDVAGTCSLCHNRNTANHPEIPVRAEAVLNTFLSIHRFYRYITLRGDPEDVKSFFRLVDPLITGIKEDWHRADLKRIEVQTKDLLKLLKIKRNQIKASKVKRGG